MATVTPLACFVSLYALKKLASWKWHKITIPIFLVFLTISCNNAFHKSNIPTTANDRMRVIQQAAAWYVEQNHQGKVSYLDPYFAFKADINPNDQKHVILLWSLDKKDPSKSLQPGDFIVWDSAFGPLECQIPEEAISENKNLTIEKYFETENAHHQKNKQYRIYIARVKGPESPL